MKRVGIKPLVMKANSVEPPAEHESVEQTSVAREKSDVRTASKEDFEEAQKKTSKLHAGLFRRLAK